jgi:hypothetical protein
MVHVSKVNLSRSGHTIPTAWKQWRRFLADAAARTGDKTDTADNQGIGNP